MGQNTDNPYSQQLPGSKGWNQTYGAPSTVREPFTPPNSGPAYTNPTGTAPLTNAPKPAYNNPTGTAPLTQAPQQASPAPINLFGGMTPQSFAQQMQKSFSGDKGNGQPSSPFGLF